jgi:predicted acyl esterase
LQVRISSWAWPGFGRNLNTLESPATATEPVVATNQVFHSAEHPSHLLLPVVPRADAPELRFGEQQ